MKIFNNENNINKVYVQVDDIIMLNRLNIQKPNTININKIIKNHNNKTDFIEFTNQNEIEFFKSLNWIIDYKKTRDLSNENFKNKKKQILEELSNITNKLICDENKSAIVEYDLLNHKLNHLQEIFFVREGLQKLPLPLVPDSDGFKLSSENCDYIMTSSLDQNKLLLSKKDRTELTENDRIPTEFFQTGLSIAKKERKKNDNCIIDDYTTNSYLSNDKKYLIIEFKLQNYEKYNIKSEKKDIKKKETEEKSIKKLIRKLIKRN